MKHEANKQKADATFEARLIVHSGRNHDTQQIALTFENEEGKRLVLTMQADLAANALVPIIATQFANLPPPPPGAPVLMQNVISWQVSRTEHAPDVLFSLNDQPYFFNMKLPTAVEFCVAFWQQAQAASQWKPPTRQ